MSKYKPELTVNGVGDKYWFLKNNHVHNEHGPAVEYAVSNAARFWYLNNELYFTDFQSLSEKVSGLARWCQAVIKLNRDRNGK